MTSILSERYLNMARRQYEATAQLWTVENRDPVVGSFDNHNAWSGYDLLLDGIPNQQSMRVLDLGCGPGRSIVRYHGRFARIDGVDIAQRNLDNARVWMRHNGIALEDSTLYLCNGETLDAVPSGAYDMVLSTITLQHICVHDIRLSLMREVYRVLRAGGIFTAQMGYGSDSNETSVPYLANNCDATGTNGQMDTRVESPEDIGADLRAIGFVSFWYKITDRGPGDHHPQWIFFRAVNPVGGTNAV